MENRTRTLLTKSFGHRHNFKRKWEEVVRSVQGRWGEVWSQNTQQFIEGEGVRGGPRAVHWVGRGVRFGPRAVYWGRRGERWSQCCPLSGEGSEIWSQSCLLREKGWEVVPELSIEWGGQWQLVAQLFIKGKSEKEKVKKIVQFILHPFFR